MRIRSSRVLGGEGGDGGRQVVVGLGVAAQQAADTRHDLREVPVEKRAEHRRSVGRQFEADPAPARFDDTRHLRDRGLVILHIAQSEETVTASKWLSVKGNAIASATWNVMSDRPCRLSSAAAIISGEKSIPTTSRKPPLASAIARSPVPVATSSARSLPAPRAAVTAFLRQRTSMPNVINRFIRS